MTIAIRFFSKLLFYLEGKETNCHSGGQERWGGNFESLQECHHLYAPKTEHKSDKIK